MALLEQQIAQLKQQMKDAKNREEQQKSTYSQILQIIHRQLLEANLSESSKNAILINLNYVQSILKDANKDFEVIQSTQQILQNVLNPNTNSYDLPCLQATGKHGQIESQIQDRNKTLQDLIEEYKNDLHNANKLNEQLQQKVKKLDEEVQQHNNREKKLKEMHLEEIKFKDEINGYEQQLFQSKIKELETNVASLQKKLNAKNIKEGIIEAGSQLAYDEQQRSPLTAQRYHSFRIESINNMLKFQKRGSINELQSQVSQHPLGLNHVLQKLDSNFVSVVATQKSSAIMTFDRDCQTDESVLQDSIQNMILGLKTEYSTGILIKDKEIKQMREKLLHMQIELDKEQSNQLKQQDIQKERDERYLFEKLLEDKVEELNEVNQELARQEKQNQNLKNEIQYFRDKIDQIQKIHNDVFQNEKGLISSRNFKNERKHFLQSNTAERLTKFDSNVMTSVTFSTVARKNNIFSPDKIERNQKDPESMTTKISKDEKSKIISRSTNCNPAKANAEVDEAPQNDKFAKKKRKQKIMTIDLMHEFKSNSNQPATITCKNQGQIKQNSPNVSKIKKNQKILGSNTQAISTKRVQIKRKINKLSNSPDQVDAQKMFMNTAKDIIRQTINQNQAIKTPTKQTTGFSCQEQIQFKTQQRDIYLDRNLVSPQLKAKTARVCQIDRETRQKSESQSQNAEIRNIHDTHEHWRVLKPTLKSRSSSKVASVKRELVKKLMDIRTSACNVMSSFDDDFKRNLRCKDMYLDQKISLQVPQSRLSQNSNKSLNLQTVNHHMGTNKILSQPNNELKTPTRFNNNICSKKGQDNSGNIIQNSCHVSIAQNRKQMEKYSLTHNHKKLSINCATNISNKIKPLGAYGKVKNSRYDTISENSRCQTTDDNEQAIYFGDQYQRKKLITNLSQMSPDTTPQRAKNYHLNDRNTFNKSSSKVISKFEHNKPEIQIALSEGSQFGDLVQFGGGQLPIFGFNNENNSTNLSSIKQEASKSCTRELIKHSIQQTTQRQQQSQHHQINMSIPSQKLADNINQQIKTKNANLSSLCNRTSCETDIIQNPTMTINRNVLANPMSKKVRILGEPPARNQSSDCYDTSIGSELDVDEQEESPMTVSAKQNPLILLQQQILSQQSTGVVACDNCVGNQNAVVLSPLLLEKLDELYNRIHIRDQKIQKLKNKLSSLKKKFDEQSKYCKNLQFCNQQQEREIEGLSLKVQKFECRLQQAQIVLNDNNDQIDLQLSGRNAFDITQTHTYDPDQESQKQMSLYGGSNNTIHYRNAASNIQIQQNSMPTRLNTFRVQNDLMNLQMKKSLIRDAENKSRQQSISKNTMNDTNELIQVQCQLIDCNQSSMNISRPATDNRLKSEFLHEAPFNCKSPTLQNITNKCGITTQSQCSSQQSSAIGKRSNSLNSPLTVHQFKRNFQSMNKLCRKSVAITNNRRTVVPVIDLSMLNKQKLNKNAKHSLNVTQNLNLNLNAISSQNNDKMGIDFAQHKRGLPLQIMSNYPSNNRIPGIQTQRQSPLNVNQSDSQNDNPNFTDGHSAFISNGQDSSSANIIIMQDDSLTRGVTSIDQSKDHYEPNSSASTTLNQKQFGEKTGLTNAGIFTYMDLNTDKPLQSSTLISKSRMDINQCCDKSPIDCGNEMNSGGCESKNSSLFSQPRATRLIVGRTKNAMNYINAEGNSLN